MPYCISQGVNWVKPNEREQLSLQDRHWKESRLVIPCHPRSVFHPPILLCFPEACLLTSPRPSGFGLAHRGPIRRAERPRGERSVYILCHSLHALDKGSSNGCVPKPFILAPFSMAHWDPPSLVPVPRGGTSSNSFC